MKKDLLLVFTTLLLIIVPIFIIHCSKDSDEVLAPYDGARPLELLQVTKSSTPDIQWLGGRVAAVGVNKGKQAALDSSLVWLMTAEDNSIGSYVTVGTYNDADKILQYGGSPTDSLNDEVEYTFWLAEKSVFDAALDSTQLDDFNFVDTTFILSVIVKGRAGGEKDSQRNLVVTIGITRDESLLEDKYIIDWVPNDIPFRRIAIRQSTLGGYTDLIWDILTLDSLEDNIYPPVIIGESIPGTFEAIPWSDSGFESNKTHFLWMVNSNWTADDFRPTATGYAWFRIFPF